MRRVRRKLTKDVSSRKNSTNEEATEDIVTKEEAEVSYAKDGEEPVDWTSLANDTLLGVFGLLNYRDRVSVGAVCKTWQALAGSPLLWTALDLRAHVMDSDMASLLAKKCKNLRKLRFKGPTGANILVNLEARQLTDLSGDGCKDLTDASLSMVAARHENLEYLQLGPELEKISSDALRVVAICCRRLRCLRLSGVREMDGEAVSALAKYCPHLVELAIPDCSVLDEAALGDLSSLRYMSVAGIKSIGWVQAAQAWSKLTNLVALDVSRTEVTTAAVLTFLSWPSLRVLSALSCPALEEGSNSIAYSSFKDKIVLRFTELTSGLTQLARLAQTSQDMLQLHRWTEWILSHGLLRIAESPSINTLGLETFWIKQGTPAMLGLIKSMQEDVQERTATSLAAFVVVDDEHATVDPTRAEAVMNGGGIRSLLDLARSPREGAQSESAKAIANLSVIAEVAKSVAADHGIEILAGLARSPNRGVAEEAAGGLWNLSVGEEHKGAIAEAGAIEALVDLALKWPFGGEGVLERAAGALANLAADDKCSMKVANAGGVHALVRLARCCKQEGVQEQAARALANLAAHGDSNGNNAAVGRETGALEALVNLTCSTHEGVRQEAAGALWNLSFDDRNREAIAAAGGVQALVALAQGCTTGSQGLQERAAGALWGLSVSEDNSIAIGQEGGVAPLIALARSDVEDVHETAAGALWNLAFNPGNALRIVNEEGVPALVRLCSTSRSKMARFMAALALAYMFDGRVDEAATACDVSKGSSLNVARQMAMKNIEAFVHSFSNQQLLNAVVSSQWGPTALQNVADSARILEAGHLRCSGAEVGRFVDMLRHGPTILKACAAFALLQFTMPGGRHALHHAGLLQKAGAGRVLRKAAASTTSPLQARVFARVVLRNLEQCQPNECIK